ncbi:MAG: cation:proton antiporter [Verrucomicrobiota bacterium]
MAICIMVAWGMAVLAHTLKQPLVLAYLLAGFFIGPQGLKWVANTQSIHTISELGLILLLFMIGLEIDLKKIISAGRRITVTGASQIFGCFGFGLLFFLGLSRVVEIKGLEIVYLAVAAALSSTVIVVKVLYDKRELDTLPGRITLGVLVLQDIFAILFLAIQPQLGDPRVGPILLSLVKVVLLVVVAFTASRYALPSIFRTVARLPELVLVGALAWCFLVGALGEHFGLSRAMGALVAGVAISTFPYTLDVIAKITSLRDFFLTLFFVGLGMMIPRPTLEYLLGAVVLCAFVLASRLLTVFLPLYWMRQGLRASFLPALNLAQVSEFSLVIMALGLSAHHLSAYSSGVLAYAFVILAVASTYAIMASDRIVRKVITALRSLSVKDLDQETAAPAEPGPTPRIFMLGFSWTASSLLEEITIQNPTLARELRVVDFNPQVHQELRARQVSTVYGDISQRHTLEHAGIQEAQIILCTLPNTVLKGINNVRLVRQLRELNRKAKIIVHSELLSEVPGLYQAGADYVCLARIIEAVEWFHLVEDARNGRLDHKRKELDAVLKERREVIP